MGWTNDQATTLDGLAVSYTNTSIDYGSGSAVTFEPGSSLAFPDAQLAGTGLLARFASIATQISALPRGMVARNVIGSDSPAFGTTAGTPETAGTVLTCTLAQAVQGRIYRISSPALAVRMNVSGRTTGVQITYTEDGSAPLPTSIPFVSLTVDCPDAGVPEPCPIGGSYIRSSTTGPLKVLLSVWVIGAGVATTASAGDHGGDPYGVTELHIEDLGIDPGTTS